MSTTADTRSTSTRPYLIRALHDWCTDNGFTPLLAVHVDATVKVPREYVKNNEIVLNVSFDATSALRLGNDVIDFKARFGGVARDIAVPVDHVIAIYARENGQGMAFPAPEQAADADSPEQDEPAELQDEQDSTAAGPATVSGGLRLASVPSSAPSSAPEAQAETEEAPEASPPPTTPAGGRPSLKRIK